MTKEQFRIDFNIALRESGVSDIGAAQLLQVSLSTIHRYATGQSCPHSLGMQPTLDALTRVGALIKELEKDAYS